MGYNIIDIGEVMNSLGKCQVHERASRFETVNGSLQQGAVRKWRIIDVLEFNFSGNVWGRISFNEFVLDFDDGDGRVDVNDLTASPGVGGLEERLE